ncbi:PREDICTED: ATP-binding cassette sub-family A member 2 [Myotis brandtii]|uniref:ATP-binding cassette sub-family A member 2 n=1 Tax=Myotis brandtii TaxID=109478 RepID=UPI00070478C5|nr:PREDICTED: ATP-binding cassette sub-family A member 2 [Myotis brandtii]
MFAWPRAGPPGPQPRPSARPVSSFSLDSVARDPQELCRFLTQNLSLPNSTAHALLAAQVDVPEVYRLLFVPAPALDVESVLPRGPEPWGRLQTSSLSRLEVRGCRWEEGLLPAAGWVFLPGGCRRGLRLWLAREGEGKMVMCICPAHWRTCELRPGTVGGQRGLRPAWARPWFLLVGLLPANETFAFVGNVTHYAQVWLNISAEIRSFLAQGRLQQHLHFLNLSLEELPPALRQDGFSLPNGSALLQQLDTIDNAACGWIQFMSKVGGWASPFEPRWCPGRFRRCPSPR